MDRFVKKSSAPPKRQRDEEPSDEWQQPKRTAAAQKSPPGKPALSTSNRFSHLNVEQTNQLPEPLRMAITKRNNPARIPPIIMELQSGWTHGKIKDVIERYDKKFHLSYKGQNKVAVQCYSSEAHQAIKEGLKSENMLFHTFTRKDERMSKVVIKGLPDYFETCLSDELDSMGFSGAIVSKLYSPNKYAVSCPPFLVQMPSGTDIGKIRSIKYIGNCSVKIERFRSNASLGTQCYRCQKFGHAARNCNHPARCVKCTEQHQTKDCPKKDKATPAKCCNCQLDHPANYSKCEERQRYILMLKNQRAVRKTANQPVPPKRNDQPHAEKQKNNYLPEFGIKTWADVTSGVQSIPPKSSLIPEDHDNLIPEDHDVATREMLDIMVTLKTIRGQFLQCTSMIDKVVLILSHLGKYV